MIWQFFQGLFRRWVRSEASLLASSLSFHTVLTLVPLLAVSLAVFQYFGGMESMLDWVQTQLMDYFLFGTHQFIMDKINEAVARIHSGALGTFGIVLVLFTCSRLFFQFEGAVQKVWQVKTHSRRWFQFLAFWLLLVGGPLSLSVVLGFVPKLLLEGGWNFHVDTWSGYVVSYALIFLVLKSMPNQRVAFSVAATISLFFLVTFQLVKEFFVEVTTHLMSYSKIYGSMAALPVFLLWLFTLWSLVLLSFALCAQWQQTLVRRKADSPVEENS